MIGAHSLRKFLKRSVDRNLSAALSRMTVHCDSMLYLEPHLQQIEHASTELYDRIQCPSKRHLKNLNELLDSLQGSQQAQAVVLNGILNHQLDIEGFLQKIHSRIHRRGRLIVIAYNPYLKWVYSLATRLGLRVGDVPSVFVTRTDLQNLARLAGFECVRVQSKCYFPFPVLGIDRALDSLLQLIPGLKNLCLIQLITLRPIRPEVKPPSLSVVIPTRNEKGNISQALERLKSWQYCDLEIIFVEGHSSDGTWEEILRVVKNDQGPFRLQAHQQTGKGKADAVRLGFEKANHELLTILDADLTMPPEMLHRFYLAYVHGHADFINGSRLVYPLADGAMRFLNRLGNIFFAKALSFVLSTKIGDSLCGTKLISKQDYSRVQSWRKEFGDFDPFGDFELIFPAAVLGLGIIDVPVRYEARTYGETNISRFKHGFQLLRMTLIGFFRIKLKG